MIIGWRLDTWKIERVFRSSDIDIRVRDSGGRNRPTRLRKYIDTKAARVDESYFPAQS